MSKLEQKILDILKEDVEYEVIGGPTPSETLSGPLDYTKPVSKATVPQATAIPGVGTIGTDDGEKNADITDVVSEDEDSDDDDKKDDKKDSDDDDKDSLEETFASLLARLAEEDESDKSDDDDDDDDDDKDKDDDKKDVKEDEGSSTPKETLPDVDSKLENPDELVTKAPGSPVAEDEGSATPKETLPGSEIDSLMDEPEKLVTKAPGSPVAEDLAAIFAGTKLSEAVKTKIKTVFETAVASRVAEEKTAARKIASQKLKEAFAALQEASEKKAKLFEAKLTEKVDGYLNFVVENWMTENRLAVERGIQAQLSEGFIRGLKQLFVEHYIEVPESKVDVVKTLASKVTKLESKLNEQVETNVKMRNSLSAYRRAEVVSEVGSGLADTQKAKLAKLAESVEYTTKKEFAAKLNDLKESYFPKVASPKKDEVLTESVSTKPAVVSPSDDEMAQYVQMLKRIG